MLTLSLNSTPIPVNRDFSMQLTWRSPVCSFDKIPSSYGLGLSFPINEHTRAIFGNPERFEKYRQGNDQKFTGFEVRFAGSLMMAGTIVITGAKSGNYEASLTDLVGELGDQELERDLHDIPKFSEEITFENKENYDPAVDNYCCFPIKNPGFFNEKGKLITRNLFIPDPITGEIKKLKNQEIELLKWLFEKATQSFVNFPDITTGLTKLIESTTLLDSDAEWTSDVTVVTPFFFLNYIVKEALKQNDFHFSYNYLNEHPQLRNLCLYNNFDITRMWFTTAEHVSVVKYESKYVSSGNRIKSYNRSYSNVFIKTKNHLPKMSVNDLLLSIQNTINVCYHLLADNSVRCYQRDTILLNPSFDLNAYFLGKWEPGEKKKSTLKFVSERDSNDLVFSESFTDLSDRRADIKDPVNTWNDLEAVGSPNEGEIRFVRDKQVFAEYKWITTAYADKNGNDKYVDLKGWEQISTGFQPGMYNYGEDEVEEIKSEFSTLAGDAGNPHCNQAGSMNVWLRKNKDFSPRLLFYKGNNTGGNATDTISLDWEAPTTGLLNSMWKQTARFWANRLPVTGRFDMPVNLLKYVIDNICQKYRTREGEFLIDEMSCELFIDRISEVEIKGFKVE